MSPEGRGHVKREVEIRAMLLKPKLAKMAANHQQLGEPGMLGMGEQSLPWSFRGAGPCQHLDFGLLFLLLRQ
jgi:hypothetical protein